MTDRERIRRAAVRYGRSVNHLAQKRYGISGTELLLKLVQGESGYRRHAVSSAGARGFAQFTASSRAEAIRKFGIDPWRSPDEAVHAATLHLRGKINGSRGLEGYNPGGGQAYVSYILGQKVGSVPQSLGGGSSGGAVAGGATSAVPGFDPGQPQGLAQKLTLVQPAQITSVGLQSPAFAAAPVMPKGYQAPQAGVVTPPVKLELPQPVGQSVDLGGTQQASGGASGGGGAVGAGPRGKVIVGPNADRAGFGIKPVVMRFVSRIAGVYGSPLTIGTGTNHNQYVIGTHRQSDHWTGNAADIPATGRALTRLGQDALIAAGMNPAKARRQKGGLYNLTVNGRRVQIIFNSNIGGNHYNHLHVGVR